MNGQPLEITYRDDAGNADTLVAFLVSDDAGMITGTSSSMDGGWTAQ